QVRRWPKVVGGAAFLLALALLGSASWLVAGMGGEDERPDGSPPTTPAPPATPAGLTARAGGAGRLTLSWAASPGADSYNVYRGTSPGGEATDPIATGVTANAYTDRGLAAGTTCRYRVSAVNAVGEGARSAEASATTPAPPAVPAGLTARAGGAGRL